MSDSRRPGGYSAAPSGVGGSRPVPPSADYFSPDPYPDESDEAALVGEPHDYDEADIDADEETTVTEDITYHAAPPQAASRLPPQARLSASALAARAAAATHAPPPQSRAPLPKSGGGVRQGASSHSSSSVVVGQSLVQDEVPEDENPFDESTDRYTAAATASAARAHARALATMQMQASATPRGGASSLLNYSTHMPSAVRSASPSFAPPSAAISPSFTASSAAASGPAVSPLSKSQSLPQKMNLLLDRGLERLEKHSEEAWKKVRGVETARTDVVDDALLASLNYDDIADHVNELALGEQKHSAHVLTLLQLLLTIAIALATAAAMYLVSTITDYCFEKRVDWTLELISDDNPYGAYFSLLFVSLSFGTIGAVMVTYFSPHSKGGGVPYVQAYLNGTNVGAYFSPRIVLVKIVALGFTIASGLTLGMEGPFVFIGSGIAILLCKALDALSFRQRLGGKYARILKNINEERVFMAGGMAAGLAVAFNAPIAGVLMALEGSTAFLTVPVVLRIFGCAMFATFFHDLAKSGFSSKIKTNNIIMITDDADAPDYVWVIGEIGAFFVIAVIGGILGAIAIWINVRVTKWRHHNIEPHPPKQTLNTVKAVCEVLALVFATTTAWFVLPYVFGCRIQHEQCFPTTAVPDRCMPVQCPDKYFSEIGTMVYSSADTVARILFDRNLSTTNDLQPFPLVIYSGLYLTLAAFVYGSHVPGGLFVPSVVVGGCMGRVVGWVVRTYISSTVNPGVYALLGAASMFGGFTRLALPAVVMLTEMTGDATYLLPIMFCTVVAKVVSDQIVPPLYPQHMAIEGLPTLGDVLNPVIAPLAAKHIMNRAFYSLKQVETLENVLDVLDKSRSMLLPVTTRDGKFVGMIMRRSVIYALKFSTKYTDETEIEAEVQEAVLRRRGGAGGVGVGGSGADAEDEVTGLNSQAVSAVEKQVGRWDDTTDYAQSIGQFDDKYANALINLTPYMDAGALTAHEETSAKRIAAIFRRLGISHLGVSDDRNRLVGVITRRHLIKPPTAQTPMSQPRSGAARHPADPDSAEGRGVEPSDLSLDLHLPDYESEAAAALAESTMDSVAFAQRRAVRARRTHSILGAEPAVRFDDEEDEPSLSISPDMVPEGYEPDAVYMQSEAFREATGQLADPPTRSRGGSASSTGSGSGGGGIGNTGGSSIGNTGSSSTKARKNPKSSLSRLNAYTKDLA